MAGERGERLFDRLLVADVGEDRLVDRDRALLGGRDRQPREGHEREQPRRLQRHGLAAGVGAGDQQRGELAARPQRDRHHVALEQRMPRVAQPQFRRRIDDPRLIAARSREVGRVQLLREPRLRDREVDRGQPLHRVDEVIRGGAAVEHLAHQPHSSRTKSKQRYETIR